MLVNKVEQVTSAIKYYWPLLTIYFREPWFTEVEGPYRLNYKTIMIKTILMVEVCKYCGYTLNNRNSSLERN